MSSNNLNESFKTSDYEILEYAIIDRISDEECTVTIEANFTAGVGWSVVKVSGAGTITFSSTMGTCAEAVADIQAGMAAVASFF
jgi:hypothetical protein